ncbi:MAG TPA: PorV/PorQ family protein [bacterium]|jgi:opacity protein-like surface antigen
MISPNLLRRTLVLTLAAVFVLSLPALAITKVGTTSMQVLKIQMDVRGIAMGNAMVASSYDAQSVWSNPGALADMRKGQFVATQINMPANIELMGFVLAHQWGDYSAVSLHAINLFTNDMMERTWEHPEGTGRKFNASDVAIGASYARRLTDRFSLGANVRYLRSALADNTFNGVAVDLGTLYKTSLRTLRLGMSIQNLGPNVRYSGSFADYRNAVVNGGNIVNVKYTSASLPALFRLGVAFDPFVMFGLSMDSTYSGELSAEMNHPNDARERVNLGAEVGYKNMFFIRAGGKFDYDEESFAAGFGLKIPVVDGYKVTFDYAYAYFGRLTQAVQSSQSGWDAIQGQPHRLAIGFQW